MEAAGTNPGPKGSRVQISPGEEENEGALESQRSGSEAERPDSEVSSLVHLPMGAQVSCVAQEG